MMSAECSVMREGARKMKLKMASRRRDVLGVLDVLFLL
uniref:Uncharacterized protein n=1 Tax=Arundo donax TaxID=35708 RepID=A0A0A8ZKC7_ARUDO